MCRITIYFSVFVALAAQPVWAQLSPTNPVGYWRVDGDGPPMSNATVLNDSAGSNQSLLSVNNVRISPDIFGSPVPQTGATNEVSANFERNQSRYLQQSVTDGTFAFGDSNFTLEAWVQLETLGDTSNSADSRQYVYQMKPVGGPNGGDANTNFTLFANQGDRAGTWATGPQQIFGKQPDLLDADFGYTGRELALQFGDGSVGANNAVVVSNLEINDNDWHYISAIYDTRDNVVRFWLDDTLDVVTGVSYVPNGPLNAPLLVGAHSTAAGVIDRTYDGKIDEMRISSGAMRGIERLAQAPVQNVVTIDEIAPPLSVQEGALENDSMGFVFLESQSTLTADLAVDHAVTGGDLILNEIDVMPGTIDAGTPIRSYLLTVDGSEQTNLTATVSFEVPDEIIGLLLLDNSLDDTDAQLGNPGTLYATGDGTRGLEIGATRQNPDYLSISADRRTITVDLVLAGVGLDQIRLVTVIPEPSSAMLASLAVLGLSWRSVRRRVRLRA